MHHLHRKIIEHYEDTHQATGKRLAQLHGRRDPQKRRCVYFRESANIGRYPFATEAAGVGI